MAAIVDTTAITISSSTSVNASRRCRTGGANKRLECGAGANIR
jgi:hypothetical protein